MVGQENFSSRLRQAREGVGMTVFQAAQFSNLEPSLLSRWEKANLANFEIENLKNGEPNQEDEDYMPSYVTLHTMALLYGVELEWLVSGIHTIDETQKS